MPPITGATARPFLHLLNPTRRLGGYSSPCQLRDGRRLHIGEVTVALGKACEQVAIGCGHSLHRVAAILALRGGGQEHELGVGAGISQARPSIVPIAGHFMR